MNFADLEKTWRSSLNRPDPTDLNQMKDRFIHDHNRRRQGQKRFLFVVGTVLTVITLRFLVFALRADATADFDIARGCGAVLLLLLP